jgi:hypothetical protein
MRERDDDGRGVADGDAEAAGVEWTDMTGWKSDHRRTGFTSEKNDYRNADSTSQRIEI